MAKDKKTKRAEHEDKFSKKQLTKEEIPELKPGMTVKVHQKITETSSKGEKIRVQVFEGIIIALKHGRQINGTMTVRKISDGIGVEKIFPLHSPNVIKIEPVKQAEVRKAKLYYLRTYKKRLTEKRIAQ